MSVLQIVWTLLALTCIELGCVIADKSAECLFYNKSLQFDVEKESLLKQLGSLLGKSFQVDTKTSTYTVGFCIDVAPDFASAVEKFKNQTTTVIGRRNETDIVGHIDGAGTWVLLTYGTCEGYNGTQCIHVVKTKFMIHCSMYVTDTKVNFLEENRNWKTDHYYMFEVLTPEICPDEGLSNGSIFCIIFFTTVGVYLLVGVAYRRLVLGAKGFEQIPNHTMWKELGNLQADGCNFLCRPSDRRDEWSHLTNNFNEPEDRDDALLRP